MTIDELEKHRITSKMSFVPFVTCEDGWIQILVGDGTPNSNKGTYPIELKRIPNWKALVQWVRHLSKKYWFTNSHCAQLIDIVCEQRGWDAHKPSY